MFVQPVLSLGISEWLKLPLTFIAQILPRRLKPAHHGKVLSKGGNWAHTKSRFHFDMERWMKLISEWEYASGLFFCCILGGIPEHFFFSLSLYLLVCLSLQRHWGGVNRVCVWGWGSWYWGVGWVITRSMSSGQEKKGEKRARLTSLTISIRLHFLLKANSSVLAWRWIAALELRFNQ